MSLRDTIISMKEDKEAAKSKWIEALIKNRNEALSLKDDEIFISVLTEIFSLTSQVTQQVTPQVTQQVAQPNVDAVTVKRDYLKEES